jgi:prephenate dehydratase
MPNIYAAFLGIEGSYSYLAAQKYFDGGATYVSSHSVREIFKSVMNNTIAFGVIPIENSLAGSVYPHYDLLLEFKPKIVGEILLPVNHQLLGGPGSIKTKDIKKVFAHPQAIAQSYEFLKSHPWIEAISFDDNASAAKMVAEKKDPSFAAIASEEAAKLYGLNILAANIQDNDSNTTRFVIITKEASPQMQGICKCSVILELAHESGSLLKVLQVIADHKANLTKLESRSIKEKPFEYQFIVDFEVSAPEVSAIVSEIKKTAKFCYILGIYKTKSG